MAGGRGRTRRARLLGLPLADLLYEELTKRGLTLERAANGIQDAGGPGDRYSQCSKQLVSCWCTGKVTPGPNHRRLIAKFLELPIELVTAKAEHQRQILDRLKHGQAITAEDDDVERRDFLRLPLGLGAMAVVGGALPELTRLLYGYGAGDEPPVALDDLDTRVNDAWHRWMSERYRYTAVSPLLPGLATDVEHAVRQYRTPQEEPQRRRAYEIAAHHYFLLRSFFRAIRRYDLAALAADRGILAAEATDDPVLIAAARWNLATVLLIDNRSQLGEEVAVEAARTLAPMTHASSRAAAMYGALSLTAASAAVRNREAWTVARDYTWNQAEPTARRTGETNVLWTLFGPMNVYVIAIGLETEAGNGAEALRLADRVDTSRLVSVERRGTYLLEVARSYELCAEDTGVLHYLMRAEREAPEDLRYHPLSTPLIRGLLDRARPSLRADVQALAQRVDVSA
jgi:hypothetical protein